MHGPVTPAINRRQSRRTQYFEPVTIILPGEDASAEFGSFRVIEAWSQDVSAEGISLDCLVQFAEPGILVSVRLPGQMAASFLETEILGPAEEPVPGTWRYRGAFRRVLRGPEPAAVLAEGHPGDAS